MKYHFDNIAINTSNHELTLSGELVNIEPLTFDLLVYLIEHQHTTITRDQLIESVWKGRIVSDTTISSAIKVARQCLGDSGKQQKYIKTIHGRGFQFNCQVETIETASTHVTDKKVTTSPTLEDDIPSHISLLVLPFQRLSALKQGEQLTSTVASNMERLLTRVPLLNISSESSRYLQQPIRPTGRQVYEDIGVNYLIDGSLRLHGASLTVSVHLTDNQSGFKIWSSELTYQQTESTPDDALSNTIVLDIVAHIEPQLNRSIVEKITTSRAPRNSRSLFLQAHGLLAIKGWRASTFNEAVALLEESSSLDATFALAPALKSLLLAFGVRVGVLDDRENAIKIALAAAAQALDLDSMDSTILGYVGCAYCDINMLDRGIPLLNSAIRINAANGQAWVALGAAELLKENPNKAIEKLEHGIHISPLDSRIAVWRSMLSMGYILLQQLDKATKHAITACEEDVNLYMPRVVLAAINIMQHQLEPARSALMEAYAVKPDLKDNEIYGLVGKKLGNLLLNKPS